MDLYRYTAGLKKARDASKIFNKYAYLFSPTTVQQVKKLGDNASGAQERRYRFIEKFLLINCVDYAIKHITDELEKKSARMTVKVNGKRIFWRDLVWKYMNERDREKRDGLFQIYAEELTNIERLQKEKVRVLSAVAEKLEFDNVVCLYEYAYDYDFNFFEGICSDILKRTGRIYESYLQKYLSEMLGIHLDEAVRHDIGYLFYGATKFNEPFLKYKNKLRPVIIDTLSGMDIDLESQKNIHCDFEDRKGKMGAGLATFERIPDKIYVTISPKGGYSDYQIALHELGHAEHMAHIPRNLGIEFKYLGDIVAISESYAFLFESLLRKKVWLKRHLSMSNPEEYCEFRFFEWLYIVRAQIASFLFQLELHQRNWDSISKIYDILMSEVLKIRTQRLFLRENDYNFYVQNYLRGQIYKCQIEERLNENYGSEWFINLQSKDFLLEMWRKGQRFLGDEIMGIIGYSGIDYRPAIREINEWII